MTNFFFKILALDFFIAQCLESTPIYKGVEEGHFISFKDLS
jgi:hypothetical protein